MSQTKIIPVEKIHISQTNVRVDEPFGDSDEDKALIYQINWGKKVVQPFKVRPEEDGYGVYVGRRRFLAKKKAGFTKFVLGQDVIIEDIDQAEARRQSLIENLDFLRQEMDPMTRAHELAKLVDDSSGGLRMVAGQLGIPPTTLSEWLKVLELAPKMQQAVSKGLLSFSDGLQLVRMGLEEKTQAELADVLETQGKEAFEKELEHHAEKKLKRGLPKGKYLIVRTVFDRVYAPDKELYEKLERLAEAEHEQIDDYCKNVLKEHVALKAKKLPS
jgi:ParB/RepB/Spo0J family partition protein